MPRPGGARRFSREIEILAWKASGRCKSQAWAWGDPGLLEEAASQLGMQIVNIARSKGLEILSKCVAAIRLLTDAQAVCVAFLWSADPQVSILPLVSWVQIFLPVGGLHL